MCYLLAKANLMSDALQVLILDPENTHTHTHARTHKHTHTHTSTNYQTESSVWHRPLIYFCMWKILLLESWNIYRTKNRAHTDIPVYRGRGTCSDVKFYFLSLSFFFLSIMSERLQDLCPHGSRSDFSYFYTGWVQPQWCWVSVAFSEWTADYDLQKFFK